MLVAVTNTKERAIAKYAEKNAFEYFCPVCNESVVLKKGKIYIHHFAHKTKSDCEHGGESNRHMEVKFEVFKLLEHIRFFDNVQMEKRIAVSDDKYRIADIYFEHNGQKFVIEIQITAIQFNNIIERTIDYNSQKIAPMWMGAWDKAGPIKSKAKKALLLEQTAGIKFSWDIFNKLSCTVNDVTVETVYSNIIYHNINGVCMFSFQYQPIGGW